MLVAKNKYYNGPKINRQIISKINNDLTKNRLSIPFLLSIVGSYLGMSGIGFHFKYGKDFDFPPFGTFKPSEKYKKERMIFYKKERLRKLLAVKAHLDRNPDKKQKWEALQAQNYKYHLFRRELVLNKKE